MKKIRNKRLWLAVFALLLACMCPSANAWAHHGEGHGHHHNDRHHTGSSYDDSVQSEPLTAGTVVRHKKSNAKYKVVYSSQRGCSVQYCGPLSKRSSARVPSSITVDGDSYPVTSVAKGAFRNQTQLTKVTIGSNVTSIGSNAFYGCSHLKNVSIHCKNLKSVGSKAFFGIPGKAVFKIPKGCQKAYHHLLNHKTGCKNSMAIKES